MKQLVFALLVLLFPLAAHADERPSWVNGYFVEQTNSYIEVVSATDYLEADARNKAIHQIIERRSLATGQTLQIDVMESNITISGNDMLTVKARIIDEYTEYIKGGQYRVYLLVQTAKNPSLDYESVVVTNRYKFSPRVFVPGLAQFHKGQKVRGALFLAGELLMIGGAVTCTIFHNECETDILNATDMDYIRSRADDAKMFKQIRTGCIAGAAAIYVWNVLDGIAAKGKTHIEVGKSTLALVPYVDPRSTGLMVSLNF